MVESLGDRFLRVRQALVAVAAGVAPLVVGFTVACAAGEPSVRSASGAASANATNLDVSRGTDSAAPLRCDPPRCPSGDELPTYEPERAELPAEMTSAEAQTLVRALEAPTVPGCTKWRKPPARVCDGDELDVVEDVANLSQVRSLDERQTQSEALFRREGCVAFPRGAVRWLRIRALEQCGVELAEPALVDGGPDLDPTIRGLLVGEMIAEQCRRSVRPMPPYRGLYEPERFQRWRQRSTTPWQQRTRKRLAACHDVAASLPAGAPGRAAALVGYAQAVAKFVTAHRAAPVSETLQQDIELRMAYYAALDEITAEFNALRDAANDEARQEVTRDGDYESHADAFAAIVVRQEPLSILGLPPLPPLGETAAERALAQLPLRLSRLLLAQPNRLPAPDAEGALIATLRRGLPQTTRAQVGAELAGLSMHDPARQRRHGLLAAGLLRLGLVTQDQEVIARAAYELRYADVSITTAWLSAITRAVLTPGAPLSLFPMYAPPGKGEAPTPLDTSGFTPELLALADGASEHAAIAVDHALLASTGASDRYFEFTQQAVERARRPGVPPALTACVNHWAYVCRRWGYFERIGGPSCDCTPFPWRVDQ